MHENDMMPQRGADDEVRRSILPSDDESEEAWLARIDARRSPKRFNIQQHSAFGNLPCP